MKGHVRPHGLAETCVGSIVLLVLLSVAAGVFVKQFHYDRAIFVAASPIAAAPTSTPTPPSQPPASAAFIDLPADLTPLSAPETFTPDNLYDKIDGKAELYTSAGVLGMRCQRLALKSDPNTWLEFFVYDMDNLRQAFAVYSMQQRADAQPLDIATYAYQTKNALFFCCGRYYIEAVTAMPTDPMIAAMVSLSKLFIAKNPPTETRIAELDFFPSAHQVPNSYMFQPENAFGFDKFKNIFSAQYTVDGSNVMAFLTIQRSADAAAALSAAYQQFLLTNGGHALSGTGKVPAANLAELMGSVELVFARGNVVAGVHAAASAPAAEQAAALLDAKISEATK
ncbi:MAG TPA: DUF6599 family protein [Verrucomicrobiae bacterium]|nr:DUF6599 family protein [Verrucomicrobiae bacterium]